MADENEDALDAEIGEYLVDCYTDEEEAAAWAVAFEDHVKTPFAATLFGQPVELLGFRTSPNDATQCQVRAGGRTRWIGVEDLDEESTPDGYRHALRLYRRWAGEE